MNGAVALQVLEAARMRSDIRKADDVCDVIAGALDLLRRDYSGGDRSYEEMILGKGNFFDQALEQNEEYFNKRAFAGAFTENYELNLDILHNGLDLETLYKVRATHMDATFGSRYDDTVSKWPLSLKFEIYAAKIAVYSVTKMRGISPEDIGIYTPSVPSEHNL